MTIESIDDAPPAGGADELRFVALGGVGEIGMNLYLYQVEGKWLMVDCGVTFGDDTMPGIDIIVPDISFIEDQVEDLAGLVLTHAHEDHVGAVPHLWTRLGRPPVYATPFTAAFLRRKLEETDIRDQVTIHEIPLSGRFDVGPFDLEMIRVTHSIPEPNGLVIRTRHGTVLHTGDWKMDPEPLMGEGFDRGAFERLGQEGVIAAISDSTNVLNEGHSGSEGEVRKSLMELVGRYRNRVAVACFASNVARLKTLSEVAHAHDRHPVLVGRSLRRIVEVAQETGYLQDIPPFVSEQDAGYLPRDKVLLICTGSQGEPRAALSRIAGEDHPNIVLESGDTVIFSSRMIPGNEKAIGQVQNRLAALGVEIVTERDHFVHVSGHPAQEELAQLYSWVRPKAVVPVHGEMTHLTAHVRFAERCQIPRAVLAENGDVIRLAPGPAEIVDGAPTGLFALDGKRFVQIGGNAWRERRRMMMAGTAVVTVVLDGRGDLVVDPQISLHGVLDPTGDDDLRDLLVDTVMDAVEDLPNAKVKDDDVVQETVRRAVRRCLNREIGRKPLTDVHVVRV